MLSLNLRTVYSHPKLVCKLTVNNPLKWGGGSKTFPYKVLGHGFAFAFVAEQHNFPNKSCFPVNVGFFYVITMTLL